MEKTLTNAQKNTVCLHVDNETKGYCYCCTQHILCSGTSLEKY